MPTSENSISAARPKASAGSTSGDMNRESSSRADSVGERAIASAAATPSTTDRPVAHSATMRLFLAAKCSCQAFQQFGVPAQRIARRRETCSEKPLVKETISTTSDGAMMMISAMHRDHGHDELEAERLQGTLAPAHHAPP